MSDYLLIFVTILICEAITSAWCYWLGYRAGKKQEAKP
jgi:hypothetical protein